jgi:hypothetical protein
MRVTVQNNIDIVRRALRRNVLEPKLQSAARKIDHQRPFVITIAIPPNERDGRTDRAQLIQNSFGAHIPKVPDFIGPARHQRDILRQAIVRVGQDKYAKRLVHLLNRGLHGLNR